MVWAWLTNVGNALAVVEVPLRVRVKDKRTTIVYWFVQSLVLLYGGSASISTLSATRHAALCAWYALCCSKI